MKCSVKYSSRPTLRLSGSPTQLKARGLLASPLQARVRLRLMSKRSPFEIANELKPRYSRVRLLFGQFFPSCRHSKMIAVRIFKEEGTRSYSSTRTRFKLHVSSFPKEPPVAGFDIWIFICFIERFGLEGLPSRGQQFLSCSRICELRNRWQLGVSAWLTWWCL